MDDIKDHAIFEGAGNNKLPERKVSPISDEPPPYLTPEQAEMVIRAAKTLRDKLIIRLLFRTGIRISELLGLRTGDIKWQDRLIVIAALKKRSKRIKKEVSLKSLPIGARIVSIKGRTAIAWISQPQVEPRRRLVPVDVETLAQLRQYTGIRNTGTVFDITRHRVWQIVKQAGIDAGIPFVFDLYKGKRHYLHPHTFRHSFGVHWVRKHGQESLRELQQHMGHQDIETTAQYLQFSPKELHRQYDELWK